MEKFRIYLRIEDFKVGIGRNQAALKAENRLHNSGKTTCALKMPIFDLTAPLGTLARNC